MSAKDALMDAGPDGIPIPLPGPRQASLDSTPSYPRIRRELTIIARLPLSTSASPVPVCAP